MTWQRLELIGSIAGAFGISITLPLLAESGELAYSGWFLGYLASVALVATPWYRVARGPATVGSVPPWLMHRSAALIGLSLLVSGTLIFTAFGLIALAISIMLTGGAIAVFGPIRSVGLTAITAVTIYATLAVRATNPFSAPAVVALMIGLIVLTIGAAPT